MVGSALIQRAPRGPEALGADRWPEGPDAPWRSACYQSVRSLPERCGTGQTREAAISGDWRILQAVKGLSAVVHRGGTQWPRAAASAFSSAALRRV